MLDFEQRSRYHTKNTDDHTFDCIQAAANMHEHAPLRVRMALLFHDSGKPDAAWVDEEDVEHYYAQPNSDVPGHEYFGARRAELALTRLNAPRKLRNDVKTLIERHMLPVLEMPRKLTIRKMRVELGDDLMRDLITHRVCDCLGKGGKPWDEIGTLTAIASEQQTAINEKVPLSVEDLKIKGGEIAAMGYKGKEIGEVQRLLLHEVLAQPNLNDHDWLTIHARKLL
jgi:tRNA nucleotidyltransferase (CCA-adding enzyme)